VSGTGSVRVWQQADGLWRWHWFRCDEDGEEEMSLTSHKAFDSLAEAEHSARAAYPDLPVHVPREAASGRRRPRRRALLVVTLVTVAALGYRAWGRRRRH
jgi:hypothetical protein